VNLYIPLFERREDGGGGRVRQIWAGAEGTSRSGFRDGERVPAFRLLRKESKHDSESSKDGGKRKIGGGATAEDLWETLPRGE